MKDKPKVVYVNAELESKILEMAAEENLTFSAFMRTLALKEWRIRKKK